MSDVVITASTDFRHHKTSYESGTDYTVSEGLATYFVMNGWATSEFIDRDGQPVVPDEVTLEVADAGQGQKAEEV